MKRCWAPICSLLFSLCASAQTPNPSFNQIATPFKNPQPLALGAGPGSTASSCGVFGDFNGDGFADYASFVVGASGGSTALRGYLGSNSGTVASIHTTLLPSGGCYAAPPVAADLNGDGKQDLLLLAPTALLVFLSNGDGTFAQPLSTPYTPANTIFSGQSTATASTPGNALAVDMNGDGSVDLLVSDNAGQVIFYPGKGDGTFLTPTTLAPAQPSTYQSFFGSMVAGDLNNDGIPDAVVCAPANTALCRTYVFLGAAGKPKQQPAAPSGQPIAMADLDHDGNQDLLLLPSTFGGPTGLVFAAGDGQGGFRTPVSTGGQGSPGLPVAGYAFLIDLNGDARPDLAFQQRGAANGIFWAAGNGDGTFGSPAAVVAGNGQVQVLEQAATLTPTMPALIDTTGTLYLPTAAANPYAVGAWFLDFGTVSAGTAAPPQTVTVAALATGFSVGSVQAAAPVTETDGCALSPGNCSISAGLTLAGTAPFTGALIIATNSTPALVSIPVFANESAPAAISSLRFSPASLSFPAQPLFTASAAQTLTLNNTGTSPESLRSVAIAGAQATSFAESDTCGGSVAAGGSCAVSLVFTPQVAGASAASLTVTDSNALAVSAALTGTGVYAASFTSAPTQLSFGQVRVGDTSPPLTAVLTNVSRQPASVVSATISGSNGASGYAVDASGCQALVAPGATCAVSVTFSPVAAQSNNATLALVDGNGKAADVSLTGTGFYSNPNAQVAPSALAFGQQQLYTTSAPQNVTVTNTGTQTLVITFVGISGSFAQTGSCQSLAPGAKCAIAITFTAASLGPASGALTITDNSGLGAQTVALSGTGVPVPAPQIEVEPTTLTFQDQVINSPSAAQTVTVTNTGTAPAAINSVTVTGAFSAANGCPASLAANSSCAIAVTFTPTSQGAATGALTVVNSAPGSPETIPLAGNGTTVSVAASSGSTTTQSVAAGSPATYTLTLAPQNGFTGTLLVTCTGAPATYQCTPSVPSLTLNGQDSANVTFTVQSTASAGKLQPLVPGRVPRSGGPTLLALPLLGWPGRRRTTRSRLLCLGGLAAVCLSLALAGCSGGGQPAASSAAVVTPPPPPTVTQMTYTLHANFASPSGTTFSQPLTLIVTTTN